MPAPVVIRLQVDGVDQIRRAFKSVEDIVARSEGLMGATASRGARGRMVDAEREAKAKKSTSERSAQDQIATWKRTDAIHKQVVAQAVRETENAEKAKTRIIEREAHKVVNIEADMYRKRAAENKQFARAISGQVGQGVHAGARATMGMVGAVMSLGGGFSITDAVHGRMKAKGLASDIANSGYMPGGDKAENKTRRSSTDVLGSATAAGMPMGFSQEDTLKGLQTFVGKTGDLDMGTKSLGKLAELARATGSNFEDLASAAAEVFNSDTTQSAEDLMSTMRGLAGEGKLGAVEIKDLAKQAAKITARAGQFGGNRADNVITLGALAQEAKATGGAANAAQATTAVGAFADTFSKGARMHAFEKMDVKVQEKDGTFLGPQQIIMNALKGASAHGTAKDFGLNMGTMFASTQARKVTRGFEDIYTKSGGGQKGLDAVAHEFDRLRAATMNEAEVKASAAKRMEEADLRFQKVMMDIKEITAKELGPAFEHMIPALTELAPRIGDAAKAAAGFVEFAAKNPFAGVAAIMGASIAKEVAAAGIKKGIQEALATSLGRAGLVIGTATVTAELVKLAIDNEIAKSNKVHDDGRDDAREVTNILPKIKKGTATPEEIEKAKALSKKLEVDRERVLNDGVDGGWKSMSKMVGRATGQGAEVDEMEKNDKAQQKIEIKSIDGAIKLLTDALAANTAATKADTAGASGGGAGVPPANRKDSLGPSEPRK